MAASGRLRRVFAWALCFAFAVLTSFGLRSAFAASSSWEGVADNDILVSDTVTHLANGVIQHEVISNNSSGADQNIEFFADIDLNSADVQLVAGYGKNSADSWSLTRTTDQAKAYEKDNPGKTVVAAVNADFFNMATGEPMGALVMEGEVKHQANGRWYFGVTKDGKAVIRNTNDLSDLQMAVGGNSLTAQNGKVLDLPDNGFNEINYARCAIGIRSDGSVLTVTTHGNFAPTSCGRSNTEIAQILVNAGCETVLELDAGGSATFASRAEGEDELAVKNTPRDGAERQVSSSLLIVSTSKPTGVFDHASMLPNNEVYTPGSKVQFTAKGIDNAGATMDLPEGIQFRVASDSKDLGSIDGDTGLFVAGDTEGTVTIEAVLDDKTVGSTTIDIAKPDEIYFASEDVNLGFGETSDLGVVVRSKKREINYKDGDLVWSISDSALGTFEGNLFIASDGSDLHGVATAASKWDASIKGEIKVNVGVLPTQVWDFEDKVVENADEEGDGEGSEEVIPAEEYYIGTEDKPGILTHSNYGRGGKESIEIVSIDDDEPVWRGENSLKLNYDFTECGEVTEGACIGTTEQFEIPGTPTGIGVWVYAPDGVGIEYEGDGSQAGFWLRGYVQDGAGNNQPYDFTLEPKNADVVSGEEQPGIYWKGWKYLEADLTHLSAPYSIQPGMTFRLMYVAGTKMGTKSANAIYFDNLQFVYGTNVDDVDAPVVDSILLNDEELENGATVNDGTVNITATFHDVDNKYTTGIDPTTVRLQIDGVNVLDNEEYESAYMEADNRVYLYNCQLNDGVHSVTVSMKDGFGNDVSETRFFTVDTGNSGAQSTVSVTPTSQSAVIGKFVTLEVRYQGGSVTDATVSVMLGNRFPDYTVDFSSDYEGSSSWSNLNRTVTLEATRKESASFSDNLIATIKVAIPVNLKDGDMFNYAIKRGSYTTDDGLYNTFSEPEQELPIVAPLHIEAEPIVENQDAVIYVYDSSDEPVEGAEVKKSGSDDSLGITDSEGRLTTDALSAEAGNTNIYASKGEEISFTFTFSVYSAQGDESGTADGIRFGAVDDIATQKQVGWLSSPLSGKQQILSYRVKGAEEWTSVDAESEMLYFSKGGNKTVQSNSVVLTGLTPATTYEFAVGVEDHMSAEREFTTGSEGGAAHDFFVIGDIQDQDTTNINRIIDKLSESSWDFGVQTGDAIDDPTLYEDWPTLGNLFGSERLHGTSLLNVMGNHEYNGDANGSIASAVYGNDATEPGSCWSKKYGDLYVAVMNYSTNAAQMREAAEWLKEDANASHAKWRVLFTHQPPYFTNATGGNDVVYEILPEAIDAAGIDAVFSGHDHSAVRTNPLKGDEVDDTGTVYYICGSTGGKEYSITSQGKFDFDKVFALATIDYSAIYLTAHVDGDTLAVTINDLDAGSIDTFEIKSKCHNVRYDFESGVFSCDRCGKTFDDYTGMVKDDEGNNYYFLNGKMQTGWVLIGEDYHYFDEDGVEEKVTIEDEKETTCVIQGHKTYVSESGEEKYVKGDIPPGHEYVDQVNGDRICSVCGWKYVELKDCDIKLSMTEANYTGVPRKPKVTVTTPDGILLTQNGDGKDYQVFTYTQEEFAKQTTKDMLTNVGTAYLELRSYRPGKNVNLNEYRGDCGGRIKVSFRIVPPAPSDASIAYDSSRASIHWTKVVVNGDEPVDEYVIYRSKNGGKTYSAIATTESTSYVDKSYRSGYKYCIGSRCVVDGERYDSKTRRIPGTFKPVVKAAHNKDGKPSLSWSKREGVSYEIWRASLTGAFKKIGTTEKGTYVDAKAVAGTKYRYKVKALRDSLNAESSVCTVECLCAAPKLTVSNRVDGKPVLSWSKVSGAVEYDVFISTSGKTGSFKRTFTGKGNTLTHASAKTGVTYYYAVRGVTKNDGNGSFSEHISGKCQTETIKAEFENRAKDGYPLITWNKISGATKYEVYRATSKNGTYSKIYTATGTSLANISVAENKIYYYKVRPVSSTGVKGSFSNVVYGKFMGTTIELSVSYRSSDSCPVIEWNKVPGAVKYKFYRSTTGKVGSFVPVATVTSCKITHTSAVPGRTYYYKVRAMSKNGTLGDPSEAATGVRDAGSVVPRLEVEYRATDGKPRLTWDAIGGARGYEVYLSTTGENGDFELIYTAKGTSLSHTSAEEGVTYTYKIRALFEDGGTTSFSDSVQAELSGAESYAAA